MDGLRRWIGIDPPLPAGEVQRRAQTQRAQQRVQAQRAQASQSSHDERLAAQVKHARIQVKAREDESADLREEARAHIQRGNRVAASNALAQAKTLDAELQTWRSKLHNLEQQQKRVGDANSNLEQAMLVEEGADELSVAVAAMEQLHVQDAVDRLQEAADQVREHDDLLTQPIFADPMLDPDAVDDELAELEAQLALERAGSLPDAPSGGMRTPASQTRIKKAGAE